jgi:hypothetical protein
MNFLRNLFGKDQTNVPPNKGDQLSQHKANCKVDIIEPHKQDSMFPTYVFVKGLPEGLGISFDSKSAADLDGFTKVAVIGEYHWLNDENSIQPFVMLFKNMEKIACQFYKTTGNMTSYVSETKEILPATPKGVDLTIVFLYNNIAKGTKLWVRFELMAAGDKTDNKAALSLFNYMITAKH